MDGTDLMIKSSKLDDSYDKAFIDDPQHIYLIRHPCRQYFQGKVVLYDWNKTVSLNTNTQRHNTFLYTKEGRYIHKKGIELVCSYAKLTIHRDGKTIEHQLPPYTFFDEHHWCEVKVSPIIHAFSSDGTHIVMDDGCSISEYYIAGDQLVQTIMLRDSVSRYDYSVNYSPDGRYLVTITRTEDEDEDDSDGPSIIELWQSNIYNIHNKCASTIQRYWRAARLNPQCVLGKHIILEII